MDEARESIRVEYPTDARRTLRVGREEFARELKMLAATRSRTWTGRSPRLGLGRMDDGDR